MFIKFYCDQLVISIKKKSQDTLENVVKGMSFTFQYLRFHFYDCIVVSCS